MTRITPPGGGAPQVFAGGAVAPEGARVGALWVDEHADIGEPNVRRLHPRVFVQGESLPAQWWPPGDLPDVWYGVADTGPAPTDAQGLRSEEQTFTVTGAPTGGAFTLGLPGSVVLAGIGPGGDVVNLSDLQNALDTSYAPGTVNAFVLDGIDEADAWSGFGLQFGGEFENTDVGIATLNVNGLTGGADPDVDIVVEVAGGAFTQGLALPIGAIYLQRDGTGTKWIKVDNDPIDGWEILDSSPPIP